MTYYDDNRVLNQQMVWNWKYVETLTPTIDRNSVHQLTTSREELRAQYIVIATKTYWILDSGIR